MERLLILFADGFPYGASEPYLEDECPLYGAYADRVLLVTLRRKGERRTRKLCGRIEVLPDDTLVRDARSVLAALPMALADPMLWRELFSLFRQGRFTPRRGYDALVTALCGNHMAMQAARWLDAHPDYAPVLLYGYWLRIPAYAALRLRALRGCGCPCVSRAHGYDVYLERHAGGYIPFHRQLIEGLDRVAAVSQDGRLYLETRYGASGKLRVHRLGVRCGGPGPSAPRTPLRLISCARVVPVKRLMRIVDALRLLRDVPVVWTHLGGGEGLDALTAYARTRLPESVHADFRGAVPHEQVCRIYETEPFHLFVNVSASEGIPVAAMEAMGCGIPAAATAVGGTPELIADGEDGFLLPRDFDDGALAALLARVAAMPEDAYARLRDAARSRVLREYDARRNMDGFLADCMSAKKQEGKV